MTMAGGGLGLGFGGNSSRRQPPAAAAAERWRRVRWERKGLWMHPYAHPQHLKLLKHFV
jgi:hypothetical protein